MMITVYDRMRRTQAVSLFSHIHPHALYPRTMDSTIREWHCPWKQSPAKFRDLRRCIRGSSFLPSVNFKWDEICILKLSKGASFTFLSSFARGSCGDLSRSKFKRDERLIQDRGGRVTSLFHPIIIILTPSIFLHWAQIRIFVELEILSTKYRFDSKNELAPSWLTPRSITLQISVSALFPVNQLNRATTPSKFQTFTTHASQVHQGCGMSVMTFYYLPMQESILFPFDHGTP